jgi:Holliday junction resolvasome RuvABC endonuclease subunit
MKILSFDQSTRVSGWAYFEDGKYVESGIVDMNKSTLETDKRSFEMAKKIWKIIDKYQPDELIIENVQQQSSPSTVIILARLAGMIIGYAEAHNVHVHILLPSQWRKSLGYSQGAKVKRQELKQQSIDYVKNNFGLNLSEDECEAICINEAAHKIYNFSYDDIWGEK